MSEDERVTFTWGELLFAAVVLGAWALFLLAAWWMG